MDKIVRAQQQHFTSGQLVRPLPDHRPKPETQEIAHPEDRAELGGLQGLQQRLPRTEPSPPPVEPQTPVETGPPKPTGPVLPVASVASSTGQMNVWGSSSSGLNGPLFIEDPSPVQAQPAPAAFGPPRVTLERDPDGNPMRVADIGFNPPVFCRQADGSTGVFKEMKVKPGDDLLWVQDDMGLEILSSRVMHAMGANTLLYHEATDETGTRRGVVSDFVPNRNLYHDPDALEQLKDPDRAIAGGVLDCWLGNFDRICNQGNVWVRNDDHSLIYGDYGCAGRKGVTAMGLPKVNHSLFDRYATRENVAPTLKKIRSLSDDGIRKLVDDCSSGTTLIRPELRQRMVDVLIHNRNELRRSDPFQGYYGDQPAGRGTAWLTPSVQRELANSALDRHGHEAKDPTSIAGKALESVRGYPGREGHDTAEVQHGLAQMIEGRQKGDFGPVAIRAEDFVAWQQLTKRLLTPQTAIGLRLGLK